MLSVIVVNYNAAALLGRCLESVTRHLAKVDHEICVVDNASSDGSEALFRKQFPKVQWLSNERNLGFSAALNRGLQNTRGCYVLWLNPDAELLDDQMSELLRYFEDNPRVGILGPQLMDPDGKRQLSCRSFPSYRTAVFHRYSLLGRLLPQNRYTRQYLHSDWEGDSIREVDWVSGACLLHRREVSQQLGGLDERFFMYCEDVDFCLRAKQQGWITCYHPVARVLHQIGGSTQRNRGQMTFERHLSLWRYYAKHFRRNPLKDAAVAAILWARCGLIMLRRGE